MCNISLLSYLTFVLKNGDAVNEGFHKKKTNEFEIYIYLCFFMFFLHHNFAVSVKAMHYLLQEF